MIESENENARKKKNLITGVINKLRRNIYQQKKMKCPKRDKLNNYFEMNINIQLSICS